MSLQNYRRATPKEIADSIQKQIVEPCEIGATLPSVKQLRALLYDLRIAAISNANWVEAQPLDLNP